MTHETSFAFDLYTLLFSILDETEKDNLENIRETAKEMNLTPEEVEKAENEIKDYFAALRKEAEIYESDPESIRNNPESLSYMHVQNFVKAFNEEKEQKSNPEDIED